MDYGKRNKMSEKLGQLFQDKKLLEEIFSSSDNLKTGLEREEVEPTLKELHRPIANVGLRDPLTGKYEIFEVIKDSWRQY